MNTERLQKLADFLRTEPVAGHFNLSTWVTVHDSHTPDPEDSSDQICWESHDDYDHRGYLCPTSKPLECNTAACALGWAPTLFHDEGLYLTDGGEVHFRSDDIDYFDYQAGAEFFDITREQSEFLFSPDYYRRYSLTSAGSCTWRYVSPTATQVADRIEWLIANPDVTDLESREHTHIGAPS